MDSNKLAVLTSVGMAWPLAKNLPNRTGLGTLYRTHQYAITILERGSYLWGAEKSIPVTQSHCLCRRRHSQVGYI